MNRIVRVDTPLGPMRAVMDGDCVQALGFDDGADGTARSDSSLARQLDEYFAGERTQFELLLEPHGSEFQQRVWRELLRVPYGTTVSYGELARRLGGTSARAVGRANATNPIAVIVPCHRVIGADGSLTGYAGGVSRKAALLALERRAGGQSDLFG